MTGVRRVPERGGPEGLPQKGEFFDSVRPVTTPVVVSGFVDPRILVQAELEAFREVPQGAPS